MLCVLCMISIYMNTEDWTVKYVAFATSIASKWNWISAYNSIYCAGNILRWHIFPFKSKQTREKLCKIAHKNYHCEFVWFNRWMGWIQWIEKKQTRARCEHTEAMGAQQRKHHNFHKHDMDCKWLRVLLASHEWYHRLQQMVSTAAKVANCSGNETMKLFSDEHIVFRCWHVRLYSLWPCLGHI